MNTITIVDESMAGEKKAWHLDILDETLSLRELLRRRIYQEVTECNAKHSLHYNGLVELTNVERTLNNTSSHPRRRLDWQSHYQRAIEAFSRLSYIVLVDDKQITNLNEIVALHAGTEVTFLKLLPLIGG